jgi:hypothetical protein
MVKGSTSRSAWQEFERRIAAVFGSRRNVMSGALNSTDDGEPRPGDVVIPRGLDLLVECKLKSNFTHHALFREARADATKHKVKHALLFTKRKGDQGYLVVIRGEDFEAAWQIEAFRALFYRDKPGDDSVD